MGNIGKYSISRNSIAICGTGCRFSPTHRREKHGCLGSGERTGLGLDFCCRSKISICEKTVNGRLLECSDRDSFPCRRIEHIDRRYRTSYGMSVIENLESTKRSGIRRVLTTDAKKRACPKCRQTRCVHRPHCPHCLDAWRQQSPKRRKQTLRGAAADLPIGLLASLVGFSTTG
jgi:hypothetical protein